MIKYLTMIIGTVGFGLSVRFVSLTLFHFRKSGMLSTAEVDHDCDYPYTKV